TSGVIACIDMPQPGLSRCRGTLYKGVLGMDSATPVREAEHQHTQHARGFHRSFLHGDVFPPHSSHCTGSPKAITPSSSTSPNAPLAHSGEYRNFKRYFATVPSGMNPLGCGSQRTPPQPRAGRLAVRPAGSKQAAGLVLPGTPGVG